MGTNMAQDLANLHGKLAMAQAKQGARLRRAGRSCRNGPNPSQCVRLDLYA